MRALKFITGHMVYNPAYTQILQMTETDLTKLSQCLEYQKAQKFHIKLFQFLENFDPMVKAENVPTSLLQQLH